MDINFLVLAGAALIPLFIGFIWYNEKVFGKSWAVQAGMTKEKMEGGNMALIFGLSYVFSFFLAVGLFSLCVHQYGVFQLFVTDPTFETAGSEVATFFNDFMTKYGDKHRSFGHGAAHGVFATLLFVLPILGINALFERKGWKYILINLGYWLVTFMLMSGVACQFA